MKKPLPKSAKHLGKLGGSALKDAIKLWQKAVPANKKKKLAARAKLRNLKG
jgi:hypothetical protein